MGDNATVIDVLTGKPIYMGIGIAATIMSLNVAKALTGFKASYRVPRYQRDVFFGGIHMTSVGLTSVEAQNEGFEADRVYPSGDGWDDHAYLVYEKGTKKVLGFSSVSKEDVGWKSIYVLYGDDEEVARHQAWSRSILMIERTSDSAPKDRAKVDILILFPNLFNE